VKIYQHKKWNITET